jgi:hypothetical protein
MKNQELVFQLSSHPKWLLIFGYFAGLTLVTIGILVALKTYDTVDGPPISEDLRKAYDENYAYAATIWILFGVITLLLTYVFVQRKGILVFPFRTRQRVVD